MLFRKKSLYLDSQQRKGLGQDFSSFVHFKRMNSKCTEIKSLVLSLVNRERSYYGLNVPVNAYIEIQFLSCFGHEHSALVKELVLSLWRHCGLVFKREVLLCEAHFCPISYPILLYYHVLVQYKRPQWILASLLQTVGPYKYEPNKLLLFTIYLHLFTQWILSVA